MQQSSVAEPAAFGLFGLGMATLVAGTHQMGLYSDQTQIALVIPWALMLGGITQLIAGLVDFKRSNIFGATAFSAYGVFWIGVAITWAIMLWSSVETDVRQFGWAFVGYLIFTIYMTVGSATINKALFVIFLLIISVFVTLIVHVFGGVSAFWPGLANFLLSIASFYTSAAVVLNVHTCTELLPVGKPIFKPAEKEEIS